MNWLIYILAGLFSGVAAGMGMGGGTLLIPALTVLAGLEQHAAQGVNMLSFLPAAALALFVHKKEGRLNLRACLPIVVSGIAGALIGAFGALYLLAPWLKRMFGAFLLLLAAVQFFTGEKRQK